MVPMVPFKPSQTFDLFTIISQLCILKFTSTHEYTLRREVNVNMYQVISQKSHMNVIEK